MPSHVVISGGSKGIGKSMAIEYSKLGSHVTIIARNQKDLDEAKIEIESHRRDPDVQIIKAVSLDLTKVTFPDKSADELSKDQRKTIKSICNGHEGLDILVNCCGASTPARFEDISQDQFRYMMDVNYFSAVNLTRLLLPVLKSRSLSHKGARDDGTRIVFVSSMCGILSFFGYSAYSASKFALIGLAQALNMELEPFEIGVTVALPPDTDTPGYAEENKVKPKLTAEISKTSSVFSPDDVAKAIVRDVRARKFCSTVGLENKLAVMATNSFMPSTSALQATWESLLAGPLRLFGYFITRSWYQLVRAEGQDEISKTESELESSKISKFLAELKATK